VWQRQAGRPLPPVSKFISGSEATRGVTTRSRATDGLRVLPRAGALLRDHPKLLVFPITGTALGIGYLGALVTQFDPALFGLPPNSMSAAVARYALAYLGVTLFPVVGMSAFIAGASDAMVGRDPSLRRALARVWARKRTLFVVAVCNVALFAAAGLLDDESRLVAASIRAVTQFVLPVAVVEDGGALASVRRSAAVVRESWLEVAALSLGLKPVAALAWVVGPATVLAAYVWLGFVAAIAAAGLVVLLAFAGTLTVTALTRTALYHAATGAADSQYVPDIRAAG
jgi:hypothetical protein